MQLDGHYSLTYVIARCAGFKPEEAEKIAYSSQYVDDATEGDDICFTNGARSRVECSAHGNYDFFSHLRGAENHRTWLPFHFLPGNGGMVAGENPNGSFINKIITTPNSHIANELIARFLLDTRDNRYKKYKLHRLGVTLHTIADTYTHQGFAGVVHKVNTVKNLRIVTGGKLSKFEQYKSKLLSKFFPLGHSAALSLPDIPFVCYSYEDYNGKTHIVDNIERFKQIVLKLFDVLRYHKIKSLSCGKSYIILSENDFNAIVKSLISFNSFDEKERTAMWQKSIEKGDFSFGSEILPDYDPEKWKREALGEKVQTSIWKAEEYVYSNYFLRSDYRKFNSAIKAHRFELANNILPKYGICIN